MCLLMLIAYFNQADNKAIKFRRGIGAELFIA